MVSFNIILSLFAAASLATANPLRQLKKDRLGQGKCGQVDVFFTGLPASHPLVTAQGFDPKMVDAALKAEKASILKAGYNIRTIYMGPEKPVSIIEDQLKGVNWAATGVGAGERCSTDLNMTAYFEELIHTFHQRAPQSYTVFNHSPNSTLEAFQRRVPITGNCTATPGKDLGTFTFCDICK